MFCPRCGNSLMDGDKFCQKCGFAIASHAQNTDAGNQANQQAALPSSPYGSALPQDNAQTVNGYGAYPAQVNVAQNVPSANNAQAAYAAAPQQARESYGSAYPVASAIRPKSMKAAVRSVTIASAIRAVIAVALIVLMAMPWLDATGIRDIMRQINKSDVAVDVARTTGISTRSNTDFEYALYDLGELVELVRSVEAVANGVQNVADGVTSSSSSSSSGKTKISDPDSASSYTALFKTITIAIAVVWWIGVGLLVLGILRTLISKKSGLMRMAFLYCLVLAVLWIVAITMIDAQLVENLRTESAALGTVGVSLPKTYFNVTALCYASAVVAGVGFIATFIKRKVKSA